MPEIPKGWMPVGPEATDITRRDFPELSKAMSTMTDPHIHLARALAYRHRKNGVANGSAQAALRDLILKDPDAPKFETKHVLDRLMAYRINDMPPPADDLSLLIDVIAMRYGYTSRAQAWQHCGINPNRGRSLLAQNAGAIDWPIWKTCRDAALRGD